MRLSPSAAVRAGFLFLCLTLQRVFGQDTAVGPVIVSQSPEPGFVNALTQIHVTFDRPVIGVKASEFLLNGIPASGVTGTGASYTFAFTQPAYGPVDVSWGPLHQIYDTATPPSRFAQTGPGSPWSYE